VVSPPRKDAKLFAEGGRSRQQARPCDPKTLDFGRPATFARTNPAFCPLNRGFASSSLARPRLRLRDHSRRCQGRLLPHFDGPPPTPAVGDAGPYPHPWLSSTIRPRAAGFVLKCHREGSGLD